MAFLSETGVSIVSKLLEYTFKPVGRHLGYLFYYERNVSKLNSELKDLSLQRDKLTAEVDDAKRKGNEIHKIVENWMNEAASFICEETRAELLNDEKCVKARCSGCNFPNFVLRYRISKQADKIANRVLEMKAISFDQISYRPALDDSIRKEGLDFETRKPISDRIMKALEDPNVRTLGMYGIGGVGKTTLAKEIARQAKEEKKLFDKVITVTVSQTQDPEKIQREIAGELGLEFSNSETGKSTRAKQLRQRLHQEMKILIILDDVWEPINLFDDVGIEFNNGQNGCKILMTSRRQVLFKYMDVKEIFCVETLTKDEATELFCSVVGDCKCLLNELVSECGGLPLVINTVAAALKGESLHKWKTALSEMRKSAPKNVDDMIQQVYPRLKMSYNFLHGEAQSLLLLCSMFPEDRLINDDDLLMYSVGWGIFNDIETVEDARDKIYTLIDTLRKNCLLLPTEKSRFDMEYYWVKVHDVIRDVAISIAKEKGWFNISSITQLEERPLEENLKVAIAISLLGDFSSQLPKSLLCPQLQSFIVHTRFKYYSSGLELSTIPDCFFKENKNLRVLDLPFVCLKSPPSSFSCLSDSLQTLRLIGCNLEDTTFFGDLKKLRCLDLSFSKFQKLSKQIGQLTRLQLLALDYCWDLEVIEPTVISSLANLEELYMREVQIKWEVESDNNDKGNASLAELKNLGRLNTLCIWIQEADVLPKDLFTKKLKRYEIIVGPNELDIFHDESSYSKVLELELNESSLLYSSGLEKLIEESEDLRLSGLIDMEEIVVRKSEDGIKFPELRSLSLEKLPKLVQFSRSLEWETASCSSAPPNSSLPLFNDKITFPVLEDLKLSYLHSVQTLWSDNLPKVSSMQNLKELSVCQCSRLKYLFSFAMARSFVHLEQLAVRGCEMMEEVLVINEATGEEERPKETTILFPQLESLELFGLLNLKRLYRGDLIIEFPTLRELSIRNCTESAEETAEPLLSEKVAYPRLENLEVNYCDGLKYLLSYDMARSLTQLQSLKVDNCKIMEEVVVIKKPFKDGRLEQISFSKLEYVDLQRLPRLKRFSSADCIKCPSLEYLAIQSCHELGTSTVGLTSAVPIVKDEREVEERELDAFSNSLMLLQLSETSFKNLVKLEIFNCNNIEYLFPLHSVESLAQLKNLDVRECKSIEEVVVEVTKEEREEGSFKKISFPKLESLQLESLPRLKRFCAADCIECPSLLELRIDNCPEYRTFTPTLTGIEEEIGRRDLVAQLPMLNEKDAFSNSLMKFLQLSETSFKNLVKLEIFNCNNIEYLFPLHSVESLAQLKNLDVRECKSIEEVVVEVTKEEREEGSFKKISFPKLESLQLDSLPRLKRFCAADCIECPSLLELRIDNCPEYRTFTPTLTGIKEEIGKRDLMAQLPMFNEKVEFPNLEELMILDCTGTEILNEIWPFPKLKLLWLSCSQDRNWGVLPFDIHKYQNLESINLRGFSCMGNLEQHEEILEVESCSRLKALLMSSSVTFKNLGYLRISQYHGMINVLASSTVKCLVQLKTMSISECDQMTEIIVDDKEGEAQNTEIAFTPLETLVLHCLPTLKSFYSGKSNIHFPNLNKVIVIECPQMENFSRGTVITSKLDRVITKFKHEWGWIQPEYSIPIKEQVWKGDLNTSIRTVWEDLHSSTKDDQNSKEQIAAHQEVEKLKENIASSSSSK